MPKFGDHIDNWMENQYCTEAYFSGVIIVCFWYIVKSSAGTSGWLAVMFSEGWVQSSLPSSTSLTFPSNIRFIWISEYLRSALWYYVCECLTICVHVSHFLFLRAVLNLFERVEYFKLQFSSFTKEGCKTQWARSFTSSLQWLLPCFEILISSNQWEWL